MKPPSVPTEEKWIVNGGAGAPAVAEPTPPTWLYRGHGRGPAPVEPSDRQRRAVEAYCRELCAPDDAVAAAAEALAAFGVTAARLGQKATADDHERVLSRATRAAAASRASIEPAGSGWRSWVVDALTAERDVGCRRVPALLARRSNGDLADREAAVLREHLHDCMRCRATELRMARAERTFLAAARLGVTPPGVTGAVTAAALTPEINASATTAAETSAPQADTPAPFVDTAAPTPRAATWIPAEVRAEPAPAETPPATDWIPAAATAAVAATATAGSDGPPVAQDPPRDARWRFGPIPAAAAVGVLAAAGIGAAAVLSSSPEHHTSPPAASTPSGISRQTPVTASTAHRHHRHVVHHRPHKPRPKPKKPGPVTSTVTSTSLTATGNAGSTGTTGSVASTGNTGAVAPAPSVSASAPVVSAPAPSSGGGGGGGGSGGGGGGGGGGSSSGSGSGSSATIQQPSLGATSAPTQGIGNKH